MSEAIRKPSIILLIAIIILLSLTTPVFAISIGEWPESTNSKLNIINQSSDGTISFVIESEDVVPSKENVSPTKEWKIHNLAEREGKIQEYYINNSTDNKYDQLDHPVKIIKLTRFGNQDFRNYKIKKFDLDVLALDSNNNDEMDQNEPIIKDKNGDFQLTESDRILKNGTLEINRMEGTDTIYFNTKRDLEGYKPGLAIISLSSSEKLESGPLNKGTTEVLLRGDIPITGFDETGNVNYVYNFSDSDRLVTSESAIIGGNISGKMYPGLLNEGTSNLTKPGRINMKDFKANYTYHINSIQPKLKNFNRGEVIIKDTVDGDQNSIDASDEIIKRGKGFVSLIRNNVSTFGSGDIVIGNSDGDQNYTEGEFLYAESGENKGYQQNEDIVISNRSNSNLPINQETKNSYTTLSENIDSNIAFLDLNQNGHYDINIEGKSKNGAEPLVITDQAFQNNGETLTPKESFVKAAEDDGTYKSIGGNWTTGNNFKDLSESSGPKFNGSLNYIPSTGDGGNFNGNEIIIEENNQDHILQKSDNVVIGGDLSKNCFEEIPIKYKFIDINHSGEYSPNYPIFLRNGENKNVAIDRDDRLVYSGNQTHSANYTNNIEYIDRDGSHSYSNSEPIIYSNDPKDDQLTYKDDILNTEVNPGKLEVSILGSYPSNPNKEASFYLTKSNLKSYSRRSPIISINPIHAVNDDFSFANRELIGFSEQYGLIDLNNNSVWDAKEEIFKENDAAAAGPDTYGDRLTAVTVTTNGTLGDKYVKSIRLRKNGTSIATATDPSPNGTWVLQPDPEAAWFGPDGNGRTFSLQASIAEDAPGGQSLALDVPSVEDADGDGAYDPGDRGLFLAQGEPVGDVGPGETLRTEVEQTAETGPPPIGLSVVAPSGNVSAAADTISIDVRGNRSGRQLTAALRALDGTGTTGQKTVTLDADGRATVEFEAEPGRYRVAVAAVTGVGNDTSSIFRVRPAGSVSIVSRTDAVERGDRARFGIGLAHAETARIELRASNGTVLERAVLRRTNGSSPFDVAVATDGNGGPRAGPGFRLEDANGTGGPLEWIAAANPRPRNESGTPSSVNATPQKAGKNRPKTPGANESPSRSAGNNVTGPVSDRLPAGTYSLFVEAAHGQNASTTFRVGASWSATVTPLVAPRDVPLEDAADVRAHATERDAIATGDRLVVAIDTGELEGYRGPIGVGGPPPHAASPGRPTGNGIRRSDAAENRSGGGPPAFVSVGPASGPGPGRNATELRRIEANDSDRFYVVMPDGVEVGPGSRLEAAMVLTEETPLVASVPNRTATESTNVSVRVREAEATLEGVENGSLDLPADPSVSIGGSTTVAPGTTATVHIEGANGSLDRERTVTVSDGGTYETTANLSGYESGTEYTVAVTADGERLSPLRSGSFLGEDTSMAAAGGGGGGGGAVYGSDSDETGDGEPVTVTATPTRTTESDPLPNPPELPDEAFERAWSRVPEPLRLGLPALLISGLGSLAVITIGRGILRLLRP